MSPEEQQEQHSNQSQDQATARLVKIANEKKVLEVSRDCLDSRLNYLYSKIV